MDDATKQTKRISKPSTLTFHIAEIRRGNEERIWGAHVLGTQIALTGPTREGTRREAAAQLLEKIAAEVRQDRHKAAIIVSLTHGFLTRPKAGLNDEAKAQARALREMADSLEGKKHPPSNPSSSRVRI
jgi:hypothetical protein